MVGQTILHYKIIEKIGEGGMSIVYKAEDTKLERTVAIKFLPRQIAVNSEERERFKIEAKAAASLNHPNIATIYAIEEVDDDTFIVMEYIKGKDFLWLMIIRERCVRLGICSDGGTSLCGAEPVPTVIFKSSAPNTASLTWSPKSSKTKKPAINS